MCVYDYVCVCVCVCARQTRPHTLHKSSNSRHSPERGQERKCAVFQIEHHRQNHGLIEGPTDKQIKPLTLSFING